MFEELVRQVTNEIADMLIEKNASYGNSALDPVRVFSRADPMEQIYVRIDDKLSRIKRGSAYKSEDTINDLIGYLVIMKVKNRMEANERSKAKTLRDMRFPDIVSAARTVPQVQVQAKNSKSEA